MILHNPPYILNMTQLSANLIPQMKPLNWLSIFFCLQIMLTMSMNMKYFMNYNFKLVNNTQTSTSNMFHNKW